MSVFGETVLMGAEMDSVSYHGLESFECTICDNVVVVLDSNDTSIFDKESVRKALGLSTDADKTMAIAALTKCPKPGNDKGSSITFTVPSDNNSIRNITLCLVPTACSRNNTPSKSHSVGQLIKSNRGNGDITIVLLPSNDDWITPQAVQAVKQFPLYCEKKIFRDNLNNNKTNKINLIVNYITGSSELRNMGILCDNTRGCCKLVDMPPNVSKRQ